jgi:hypothetical protein
LEELRVRLHDWVVTVEALSFRDGGCAQVGKTHAETLDRFDHLIVGYRWCRPVEARRLLRWRRYLVERARPFGLGYAVLTKLRECALTISLSPRNRVPRWTTVPTSGMSVIKPCQAT